MEVPKTTVYVASRYLTVSKPQAETAQRVTAAGGTAAVSADGTVSVPDSCKAYVDKAWQVGMNSGWKYADFRRSTADMRFTITMEQQIEKIK